MSNVINFDFRQNSIRVVDVDVDVGGNPWFVAADVCRALDMSGYASHHTSKLKTDEKLVLAKSHNLSVRHSELFGRTAPSVTLISESGLYKIIMRSDKPEARVFQGWVTRDVLPAIRKDEAILWLGTQKDRQ